MDPLEKNRAYVTELSYNQQNGRLALRIREKETGEVVYAGHLLIEPLKETVQAVVGSMHYQARSNPDQWRFAWNSLTIVPGYEQFGPPIALASPPAIYLWQEQADGSQQQVNRTLFKEDVAFGIGIGRAGGMLPGRFYCHILDEEGNRVSTYSLPELPAVVRLADCVPGDYTAQLVYVDGDYEGVIGTRRFRVRGARAAFTLEVRPGEDADLQQAILEAYYAGYKEIVIPPGTYRLKPQDRIHLNFRNLEDVTIVARDVEIICTETTRALNIENCRNLHIIGLTIDYDPLPFTQGWIRDMAPDKSWIEVERSSEVIRRTGCSATSWRSLTLLPRSCVPRPTTVRPWKRLATAGTGSTRAAAIGTVPVCIGSRLVTLPSSMWAMRREAVCPMRSIPRTQRGSSWRK